MADQWWQQDAVVQDGGQVQAIPGRVDPYRQRADARAEEDQAMQRDRDLRDAETKARQAQLDAIRAQGAQFDLESKQRQSAATGGIEGSVEQGKAAAFFRRAVGSNADYEKAGLDPDSMIGQNLGGMFPNATAAFSTDERNSQRSREREFIAAVLRYDSGAAIPPSEFENAYQIYFPTSSAGPQEIEQKKIARQRAIEGLKLGAGPVAARVDQQDDDPSGAFPGGIAFGDEAQPKTGYRMKPENEAAYQAFVKSQLGNPNASIESINGFLSAIGEEPLRNDDKAAAFIESLRAGKISGGVDYSTNDAAQRAELQRLKKERENLVTDPVARGVTDTLAVGLSDEIRAAGDTIFNGGEFQENLYQQRQIDRADEAVNPTLRLGGQLAGALALPSGIGRATAQGGVRAGAVRAGQEGAAFSAAYGFGSGEDMQSRGVNALLGAAGGAAVGYGAGRAIPAAANALGRVTGGTRNALARFKPQDAVPTVDSAGIAAAGQAENVPVNRAMVDPSTANKVTAVESTIAGGPQIRGGMQKVGDAIADRVTALGRGGRVLDEAVAGEIGQNAVYRADKWGRDRTDRYYKAYIDATGDPPADPVNAIARIDEDIGTLSANPKSNRAEIEYLNDVRGDLASGKATVESIRSLRTSIRGQIKQRGLDQTQAEARVSGVLDSAMLDIEAAIGTNKRGLRLLHRANKAHHERKLFTKGITEEILGKDRDLPLDPAQAFAKIQRWAKPGGDGKRLITAWKTLTRDESDDLAATMANPLGRDNAGNFSPDRFITSVAKLSPRARVVAFGPEGARSIANLIKLSDAHKRVTASFNHSKSGVAINSSNYRTFLFNALGMGGGAAVGGLPGVAVGAGVGAGFAAKSALSARSLMSRDIQKWIETTPATASPQVIDRHFGKLREIAARQPLLAGEIEALQSLVMDAAKQSPGRVAAGQQENDGREKPPKQ